MNRKVKRYDPISSDGTCGMCIEDADYGAYVEYKDYATLRAECDSLWSTYVALVDKLGIDTEKAKTADGKPSDVIVSYIDKLRAENERLRAAEMDALRYRHSFLMPDGGSDGGLHYVISYKCGMTSCKDKETIDEIIDQAMKGDQQ